MIELTPTNDLQYVKSVLSRPGMKRLCMGGLEGMVDIDKEVEEPGHLFLEVRKDGERKGFIVLTQLGPSEAEIHLALQTRGLDTIDAVRKALAKALSLGFKAIHAIYPYQRTSVNNLALKTGFKPIRHIPILGDDWIHSTVTLA